MNGNSTEPRRRARRLLLELLRPRESASAARDVTRGVAIDWDWLLDRAESHRVTPLLARRLSALSDALPERALTRVRDFEASARDNAGSARRTLSELTSCFGDAGIRFVLLKGPHLSESVYHDPTLRAFGDLDLLLPAGDVYRAEQLLLERGYYFWIPRPMRRYLPPPLRDQNTPAARDAAREVLRERHRHVILVLREDDPRLRVELHWHITKPGVLKVRAGELLERTTRTEISGMSVETLDPHAAFVHVAVHALEHSPVGFRLLHLCDVAWLLEHLPGASDRREIMKLAKAWGAEAHVRCASHLAGTLFSAPVAGIEPPGTFARAFLLMAGMTDRLVDGGHPAARSARLLMRMLKETSWELALGRRPSRAAATLATVGRTRLGVGARS